jgi:vanillate O-demethylase monooxygenase subunit
MIDRVLANEWFPVLWDKELGREPRKVELLGEEIVLFRTRYGTHAFRDLCVHRGTPLSLGHIDNDEIVCAYHGWRYDHTGQCVQIPAQDSSRPIPNKACAKTYRCQQQYDMLWVCLGQPTADIPQFKEYGLLEFQTIKCGPYVMHASAPRVMENLMDPGHLSFVHDGLLGDSTRAKIPDFTIERHARGFSTSEMEFFQPNAFADGVGRTSLRAYHVLGPLTLHQYKYVQETGEVVSSMFWVIPHSEKLTSIFVFRARNYDVDQPNEKFVAEQDRVMSQDKRIVESQKPELLPLDLSAEFHVKSDRVAVQYRQWLNELGVVLGTISPNSTS